MNWLRLFFPYRTHLEDELKQQRADFTARLLEKDVLVRQLRLELANIKVDRERMWAALMPPRPLGGQIHAAQFQGGQPDAMQPHEDWQGELSKLLKEEEDGIRSGRRIQEHEPGADDGA